MCNGGFSSAWREDEVKLGLRISATMKKTKHNNLLQNSDISKLEHVYFNGGEPMMSRDHINVLTHIVQNGTPAAVQLSYSTNGTCAVTEEVLELWSKFGSVKLLVSIDCVGPAFEYVRYPAKWKLVEKNLLDFKEAESKKFQASINASIGVHNILYYDELYNWCTEHDYEHMVLPVGGNLSALNFPLEHKDHLLDYLNKLPESDSRSVLISLANSISSPSLDWIGFLNSLDRIRNNSWKIELQKLYDLIK
jgi:MoaA/NifB/PqqE/SkfB family radical SAM enzyme